MKRLIALLVIKCLAALLMFASQILPANCFTVPQFGTWSYINSIIAVLVFVAMWGSDRYCLKEVSLARKSDDPSRHPGGKIFASYATVFLNAILITGFLWWYLNRNLEGECTVYLVLLCAVVLVGKAVALVSSSIAKGLNQVLLSEFVFGVCRPLLFVVPMAFIYWQYPEHSPDRLTHTFLLFAISFILFASIMTALNSRDSLARFDFKMSEIPLIYQYSFFFFLVGVGVPLLTNINTIQLGNIRTKEEVALFSAAAKLVSLILLGLVSANLLIAPKLSPLYEQNNLREMHRLIRNNNAVVALLTLIPTLVVILFAKEILGLYGTKYVPAAPLLQTLAIGQIFSVACGPVVLTASLIGMQRQTATTVLYLCAVNWILCALLIPKYGPMGAVIASVITGVGLNFILANAIWRKTGLNVTMLNLVTS